MNFQGLLTVAAVFSPFFIGTTFRSVMGLYNKDIYKYKNRQYLKVKISLQIIFTHADNYIILSINTIFSL